MNVQPLNTAPGEKGRGKAGSEEAVETGSNLCAGGSIAYE